MDVYVYLFCVCAVLCIGSSLATGSSPVQGDGLEYLHRSSASRRRRRKGDAMPGLQPCQKIIVAKSKQGKTGRFNSRQIWQHFLKEGYGSKTAVLPVMMMLMMIMINKTNNICNAQILTSFCQ
jgi:hypothetical protein